MLLCSNHHILFDTYAFYIRYDPEVSEFFFVRAGYSWANRVVGSY